LKDNAACVLIYKSFSYIVLSQAQRGRRGDDCWPQPCDPQPRPFFIPLLPPGLVCRAMWDQRRDNTEGQGRGAEEENSQS